MTRNVELVRRLFAAVEDRDLEGILGCYAADVEIHESGSLPYGGTYRGHDGAMEHAAAFLSAWGRYQSHAGFRLDPVFLEADDGTVAASFRHRAVAPDGRRLDSPEVGVYELREGLIARSRMFHFDTGVLNRFLGSAERDSDATRAPDAEHVAGSRIARHHPPGHDRQGATMSATEYAVVNPATGETLKNYETITDADLEAAIGRAHDVHEAWGRRTSVEERARIIGRVGELHLERRDELADIIVREMGKPLEQSRGEVEFAASIYEYYAEKAAQLMADEPIELLEGEGSAFIRRSSVGVLLGIMPWNYPYYQVARFAGPNLATGNTVLLKHAPQCPESSAAMEQIFHEAGVPADAYINIYATNEQIEWVIADPRVQGVSLTGSGRAGAAVAEIAGRNLKKVVLELGGSDPFILLGADDLDAVVEQAVGGRLENTGQACNAAKRFIVLDEHYDAFVEKFGAALSGIEPGDPTALETTIGPLSSTAAADRLEEQVQEAVDGGAKLVAGGGREGNFFKTAVLTDITPDNPAYREEFFGPVAQVYKVGSEAEAIALANDTPYGLGSYVFTNDQEQALRVADQIEAGMVFINAVGAEGAELPFGGVKASGFGRELGRTGADEFLNKKMIRVGG